jgi:plasmid stability protein
MATITLRGIDDALSGALKERARREDSSVNTVTLKILRESLGIEKKKRSVVYDDLDHLAGTWNADDLAEFESAAALFEKVDEGMWK